VIPGQLDFDGHTTAAPPLPTVVRAPIVPSEDWRDGLCSTRCMRPAVLLCDGTPFCLDCLEAWFQRLRDDTADGDRSLFQGGQP
jgi:hypothetical protein